MEGAALCQCLGCTLLLVSAIKLLNAHAYHGCFLMLSAAAKEKAELGRLAEEAVARLKSRGGRTLGWQERAWDGARSLLAHNMEHAEVSLSAGGAVVELVSEYKAPAMTDASFAGSARHMQCLKQQATTLHEEKLAKAKKVNHRHLEQLLRRHSRSRWCCTRARARRRCWDKLLFYLYYSCFLAVPPHSTNPDPCTAASAFRWTKLTFTFLQ